MRRILTPRRLAYTAGAAAVLLLTGATDETGGCSRGAGEGQRAEASAQQDNYDQLVAGQPSSGMGYSPTRETIAFWVDTWDEPGKLSYVYLQSADGTILGYYVLEGLPVSYCASQTPTYRIVDSGVTEVVVPAPALDGVYYNGSGSCDTYYGRDATTGAYIEYTAGLGINVLLYDQPLPAQALQGRGEPLPLGPTAVGDIPED